MKKIILYIAASIDGRIAEPDGGIEWLSEFPITEKMNYGYKEFMASIDTIIMAVALGVNCQTWTQRVYIPTK